MALILKIIIRQKRLKMINTIINVIVVVIVFIIIIVTVMVIVIVIVIVIVVVIVSFLPSLSSSLSTTPSTSLSVSSVIVIVILDEKYLQPDLFHEAGHTNLLRDIQKIMSIFLNNCIKFFLPSSSSITLLTS